MGNNVLVKLFTLLVLVAMFLVPLGLIWSVVSERARYRGRVADEVAQSSARAQLLFGPVLVIETPARRARDGRAARDSTEHRIEHVLLPDSLDLRSRVTVEERRRGIYRVPVYRAANHVRATFKAPARPQLDPPFEPAGPSRARLIFGVSDARGLRVTPQVTRDGVALDVEPGAGVPWVPQGFSAPVELTPGATFAIEAEIDLVGTDRLGLVPLGANTEATIESAWPHPGFTGGFSPDEREITAQGFRARWRLSRFATGVPGVIAQRLPTEAFNKEGLDIGVKFVQPVDIYQQSERAVKYGMLFVTLTFVAFFLFEILRRLAIHPIQYALVAAALALFFLLLVSLSEHLPFAVAYTTSSAACVGLLLYYAGHVLGSLARGLGFGGLLAGLYALLYVILQSEDYALLLGTLLLFAALTVVMIATRRVDWYKIGARAPSGG